MTTKTYQRLGLTLIFASALTLSGCGGGGGSNDDDDGQNGQTNFKLQLLHLADMDGDTASAVVQNSPRISAIANLFKSEYPNNTVFLSSGDNYIPGPTFLASDDESLRDLLGVEGNGRSDILILNELGVQVSALGNHEFDNGPGVIAELLVPQSDDFDGDGADDGTYPGAAFPYLSSNLDFTADGDLASLVVNDAQEASSMAGKIAGSTVITVNGETIGVVGATTPTLASISSPGGDIVISPADSTDINALAAVIQQAVDGLVSANINKIILLAHMQQIGIEDQLSGLLSNVDIIVAGGSNTLLADSTDHIRAGDSASGTYPLIRSDANGEPVALVNCASDYRYLCRLVVEFDDNGLLLESSIDADESGAYATDDQGLVQLNSPSADPEVEALAAGVGQVLQAKDGNTFGLTTVYLEGRRSSVRTEETNLGNLTADANLWQAQQFDPSTAISIKNGGGIRAHIGQILAPPGSTDPNEVELLPTAANPVVGKAAGAVSQLDIENTLRFNNELTLLTVTAAQLLAIVEHGVAASDPGATGATPGRFPQVGGIRFSFDPNLAANARVQSLLVLDDNGAQNGGNADIVVQAGVLQGDPNRLFRLVTLNFLANDPDGDGFGGDGYPFPQTDRADLVDQSLAAGSATFADAGSEQDALAEYLAALFPASAPFMDAETAPEQDERIQNLSVKTTDTVIP